MVNIIITNDAASIKTRLSFEDKYVLISTTFFSDSPVPEKTSIPHFSRKWKDKWFIKTVSVIPSSFIPSILLQLKENKQAAAELQTWIMNIYNESKQ